MQQQPARALRVVEEQDLPGPQLRRGRRSGEHHVPGLDPGSHRTARDDVRRVAHRLGGDGDDDEPGQPGQHQGGEHPGSAEDEPWARSPGTRTDVDAAIGQAPLPAEPGCPLHSCHGQVFRASHVKSATDCLLWAASRSIT